MFQAYISLKWDWVGPYSGCQLIYTSLCPSSISRNRYLRGLWHVKMSSSHQLERIDKILSNMVFHNSEKFTILFCMIGRRKQPADILSSNNNRHVWGCERAKGRWRTRKLTPLLRPVFLWSQTTWPSLGPYDLTVWPQLGSLYWRQNQSRVCSTERMDVD